MFSADKDVNAEAATALIGAGQLTAGGAGDNTAIVGKTIDRLAHGGIHMSALVDFGAVATLAEAATLSLAAEYQDSDNGSSWSTAVPLYTSTVIATGGAGGSTETALETSHVDLSGLKRYVRFNCTPDLSAADTDVAAVVGTIFMVGGRKLPT